MLMCLARKAVAHDTNNESATQSIGNVSETIENTTLSRDRRTRIARQRMLNNPTLVI